MKKFISGLLTFVLILSLMAPLSLCVSAEVTELTQDSDGYYLINNEEELWFFENNFATFAAAKIKLTDDIEITSTDEWSPSTTAFTGTFDGQGHTITGLKNTSATTDFGFIPKSGLCTVKNLTLKDYTLTVSGAMGGVIGYVSKDGTKLDNVHVEGANFSQTASKPAGGLVGATYTSCSITFKNCSFEGKLTNESNQTGGIIGNSYGNVTATNCYVNATITSNGSSSSNPGVGGIVGWTNQTNVKVSNSYVAGSIISKGERVGGIGGRLGYTVLTDCVVTANVTNGTKLVAAFAAQCLSTATSTFTRCVFTGTLNATGEKAGAFTAQGNGNVTITDCILLGSVTPATLPVGLLEKPDTYTITATGLYCDTTVYTGLASTTGVVGINGKNLAGANGAKNLPDLFSEANRENWTITDTCPMPTKALTGLNVANLEMLAFQTDPEEVAGEYNIRFVGFIDGVDYKEAGVIITAGDQTATVKAKHVYNSIYEKLGNTTNSVDITKYGYETEDGHFLAIVLQGVPADVTEFTVTPYVITNDNVTVYGVSGTASVTVTQ